MDSQASKLESLPTPQPQLTREEFIARGNKSLPTTETGLLIGYMRADLISPADLDYAQGLPDAQERAQRLSLVAQGAYTPLSYTEGFPAQQDGRPFWHKLPYEPAIAFAAFERYTEQGKTHPRSLYHLLDDVELKLLHQGTLELPVLRSYATLYYWQERARAYDIYQAAAYRHIRTRRALSTDDYLYEKSSGLLEKLIAQMDTADFMEQLRYDPGAAASLMDKLVKIRRAAAGLPSSGPGEELSIPANYTQIDVSVGGPATLSSAGGKANSAPVNHKGFTPPGHIINEQGHVVPDNAAFLRGALNDPEAAKLLQEVIIRVSTSQGATKRPRWFKDVNPDEGEDEGGGGDTVVPVSSAPIEDVSYDPIGYTGITRD